MNVFTLLILLLILAAVYPYTKQIPENTASEIMPPDPPPKNGGQW